MSTIYKAERSLLTHLRTLCVSSLLSLSLFGSEFYQLPANINDFADNKRLEKEMLKQWNWNMNAFTRISIAGNPWINEHDYPRSNYIDPLEVDADEASIIQPITWTAFPNRISWYFSESQGNPYRVPDELLYALVDEGRLNPDQKALKKWISYIDQQNGNKNLEKELKRLLHAHPGFASTDLSNFAPIAIPTDICPVVNWKQDPKEWSKGKYENFYAPSGPRGWKDEYNEWVVTRNAEGQITKVSFTAENPEYWVTLWRVDPTRVLSLYRELVNKNVKLEDLYLKDKDGNYVKDYEDKYVYNPLNRWNYGNTATDNGGGAVHLTSPPNTVSAEVFIAAAATIIRRIPSADYNPQENNCYSQYGLSFRNSDPNIGFQVNQIVKNIGVPLTLNNPVALYMQTPDFSNYKTPDGTDASRFFKVVRGKTAKEAGQKYDQILHATFEVPKDLNYTVSDILINNQQIWWGSQIAETFNQALAGKAYTKMPRPEPSPQPAVVNNNFITPWPQALAKYDVLMAVWNQHDIKAATIPLIPPAVYPGTVLTKMGFSNVDRGEDTKIVYTKPDGTIEPGIKVTITGKVPYTRGFIIDAQTSLKPVLYLIDIEVGENVKAGQYGVQIITKGHKTKIPSPASLTVRAKED